MVPGEHPLYEDMDGEIELRLVFNDLSKIEPLASGDVAPVDAGPGASGPAVRWLLHCEGSGKLYRARSRLYRSQILQVDTKIP